MRATLAVVLALALATGVAHAHYGDPNTHPSGCEADEQDIRVTGLAGDFCSPPCGTNGTCPTDVPKGVTAKPECVLNSPTGAKYCALVCTPKGQVDEASLRAGDAQCGTHASCKAIQGTGLCTYDDMPPPPSSAHWKPVNSPSFDALGVVIDVAFTKDGTTGFAGAGSNGVGAQIVKTVDSGVTWKPVWPTGPNATAFNIFLASAVKSPSSAVVAGALFETYTKDGTHFNVSKNGFVSPAQDAHVMPGGDFALVGQFGGNTSNGIATSSDGVQWTPVNMKGVNETLFPARYGAFPSATTWFVTAGLFPANNVNAKAGRSLTHRVSLVEDEATGKTTVAFDKGDHTLNDDGPAKCSVDPDNCFSATIVKTTDAGKTWKQVYTNINTGDNIYPNGINCFSTMHCVALLEGDTARILVTHDGGATWNETMHDTDSASSLVSVFMIDDKEVWASGGHMTQADFEGRYWHSLDGGSSWTKEAIPGLYIFSFDMISAASGYSVALTEQSGVELLKYDAKGSRAADGAAAATSRRALSMA